jgi:hypothetical protein
MEIKSPIHRRPNTITADFSQRPPDRYVVTQWFAALDSAGVAASPEVLARVDRAFTAIEAKSIEPREGLPGRNGIATLTAAAVQHLRERSVQIGHVQLLEAAESLMPFGIRQSFQPIISAIAAAAEQAGGL